MINGMHHPPINSRQDIMTTQDSGNGTRPLPVMVRRLKIQEAGINDLQCMWTLGTCLLLQGQIMHFLSFNISVNGCELQSCPRVSWFIVKHSWCCINASRSILENV